MKWDTVNTITGLIAICILGLSGCGGESASAQNTDQTTPPSISSLQYTPATSTVNTMTTVNWQFNFSDEGGNISTGTYTVTDPNGIQVYKNTTNLTIPAGIKTGTELGTINNVTFLNTGIYTARIYVTDSAGSNSNTLTATFTITPYNPGDSGAIDQIITPTIVQ